MRASHEFPPVFDENSEILILGSFPSVKSRQESFFYANPQNRFWKLMAQLLNESTPKDTKDKIAMLKKLSGLKIHSSSSIFCASF